MKDEKANWRNKGKVTDLDGKPVRVSRLWKYRLMKVCTILVSIVILAFLILSIGAVGVFGETMKDTITFQNQTITIKPFTININIHHDLTDEFKKYIDEKFDVYVGKK